MQAGRGEGLGCPLPWRGQACEHGGIMSLLRRPRWMAGTTGHLAVAPGGELESERCAWAGLEGGEQPHGEAHGVTGRATEEEGLEE